jgi:hypothetical protein
MHPQLKLLFPNDLPLVESFFFDLRAPNTAVTGAPEPEAGEDDDVSRSLEETVTEWSGPDE